ncbi:nucleolin-like [Sinocyclocheilus anshuiensis]|uniref:nucleolin-like n=1 Tax=Sinocyclocheilus anshuiensis TaxID=1608454 RepID=UPI0007B844ED|nr:PREDICTED: nucleolin-like [Sinocyclocheilus anshuiensis]
MLSTQLFYGKRSTAVVPADPAISDDEGSDDVADPDFIPLTDECPSDMGPSAKRKCVWPAVEELADEDDDNEEEEDEDQPAPQAKGRTKKGRPTTWKKVDLDNQNLPEYQHVPPDLIETPYNYFSKYFSPHAIKHITY